MDSISSKKRSVIFLHNSYYHFFYLAKALRERGWDAISVSLEDPINSPWSLYYHGEDLNLYSNDREIFQRNIKNLFNQAKNRFDLIHFAGDGWLSFFPQFFNSKEPKDIIEWISLGKKIAYIPSGCSSGTAQSSVMKWSLLGGKNVCDTCKWQNVPEVCSDEKNLAWGKMFDNYCDIIFSDTLPSLDYLDSPKAVPGYYVTCVNQHLWDPQIQIPDNFIIEKQKDEVLIYHAVGHFNSRTSGEKNIKGTHSIIEAVEKLISKGFKCRLIFKTDIPNIQLRFIQAQADIVVDELNIGRFGATSRESLMLGKPTVCYLNKKEINTNYSKYFIDGVPIISATEETVYQVLEDLLLDYKKRLEIGKKSREYALKWFTPESCARRYEKVYDLLFDGKKNLRQASLKIIDEETNDSISAIENDNHLVKTDSYTNDNQKVFMNFLAERSDFIRDKDHGKEPEFCEGDVHENLGKIGLFQKSIFGRRLNILIVLASPTKEIRTTIKDHILAFERYSDHNIHYLNVLYEKTLPSELKDVRFDLIIFHTIFLSARWDLQHFKKILESEIVQYLQQIDTQKIIIPQDEFLNTDALCDFINDFGIKHVFTCASEEEWYNIYNKVDFSKTKFHTVLTGYIEKSTLNTIRAIEEKGLNRDIDIGYRAWHAEEWLGRHGLLKCQIAETFKNAANNRNLNIDISTREEDTFYGNKWYEFLLKCKYFIGTEGGASLLDRDGKLKNLTRDYKKLHPNSTFKEIEAACFPGQDGNLRLFAISPRHLEACATKTCQILIEGKYNGILLPGIHYIELKSDYSNLNEVMELIKDERLRIEITERAYNDIILSDNYSYRSFVEYVINESLKGNSVLAMDSENGFRNFNTGKILDQAEIQINHNNVFGAYNSVKTALKIEPGNLAASYYYNVVLFKLDETDSALSNINNLLKMNPKNESLFMLAANIEVSKNNYASAENYLKQAIEINPYCINILNQYGKLKFLQEDYSESLRALTHSLKIKRENPLAFLLIGKTYNKLSEYQKAVENLKYSLEYEVGNIEAWVEILSIAEKIQSNELIKTAADTLSKLDPNHPELKRVDLFLNKVINETGLDEMHVNENNLLLEAGNEEVIDKKKLLFDVSIAQFDMLLERGISLLYKNKLEGALSALIRANEIDPQHPRVLFYIGFYLLLKNSPERAIIYFQKVVEKYPAYDKIDLCLGLAYDFAQQPDKALSYYTKVAEVPDDNLQVSKLIFLFFTRRGNFSDAKKILLKLYKEYPKDLQVLKYMANFAEFQGDLEIAKKIFNEILLLQPKNCSAKRGLRRIELNRKFNNNGNNKTQPDTITMLVDDKRIDRRVLDEALSLTNDGWKVTVIAGNPSDELGMNDEDAYPDLNIIRVKEKGFLSLELMDGLINYEIKLCKQKSEPAKINKILFEVLPDVEHHNYFNDNYYHDFFIEALENPAKIFVGHDLTQLTTALIAAKYFGSLLVYDSHELYPGQFEEGYIKTKLTGLEKSLIKYVDKTITVNQSIALEFHKNYNVKAEVILNCPSIKDFMDPFARNNYFREKYNLSSDNKILIYQGNLTAIIRNLENLIEAMSLINNRKIILVMMGPDYGDKELLKEIAKNNNLLDKSVFFHSPVPQNEIIKYTTSADAGIIPYPAINMNHYYCTPNKLFEFIVSGLPIIANDLPELRKFVSTQGIGINYKMTNSKDIAAAIDYFFDSDILLYKKNLEKVSKKYTWKSQEGKIKEIYKEVLAGGVKGKNTSSKREL